MLLDLERLVPLAFQQPRYRAPSKFPVVHRDLSLLVDSATSHAALERTIREAGGDLLTDVRLFDLYQGKGVAEGRKSVAYSLSFTSFERTLDDQTIEAALASIVTALDREHGARLRGAETPGGAHNNE